jgi:hypothetical protein
MSELTRHLCIVFICPAKAMVEHENMRKLKAQVFIFSRFASLAAAALKERNEALGDSAMFRLILAYAFQGDAERAMFELSVLGWFDAVERIAWNELPSVAPHAENGALISRSAECNSPVSVLSTPPAPIFRSTLLPGRRVSQWPPWMAGSPHIFGVDAERLPSRLASFSSLDSFVPMPNGVHEASPSAEKPLDRDSFYKSMAATSLGASCAGFFASFRRLQPQIDEYERFSRARSDSERLHRARIPLASARMQLRKRILALSHRLACVERRVSEPSGPSGTAATGATTPSFEYLHSLLRAPRSWDMSLRDVHAAVGNISCASDAQRGVLSASAVIRPLLRRAWTSADARETAASGDVPASHAMSCDSRHIKDMSAFMSAALSESDASQVSLAMRDRGATQGAPMAPPPVSGSSFQTSSFDLFPLPTASDAAALDGRAPRSEVNYLERIRATRRRAAKSTRPSRLGLFARAFGKRRGALSSALADMSESIAATSADESENAESIGPTTSTSTSTDSTESTVSGVSASTVAALEAFPPIEPDFLRLHLYPLANSLPWTPPCFPQPVDELEPANDATAIVARKMPVIEALLRVCVRKRLPSLALRLLQWSAAHFPRGSIAMRHALMVALACRIVPSAATAAEATAPWTFARADPDAARCAASTLVALERLRGSWAPSSAGTRTDGSPRAGDDPHGAFSFPISPDEADAWRRCVHRALRGLAQYGVQHDAHASAEVADALALGQAYGFERVRMHDSRMLLFLDSAHI